MIKNMKIVFSSAWVKGCKRFTLIEIDFWNDEFVSAFTVSLFGFSLHIAIDKIYG